MVFSLFPDIYNYPRLSTLEHSHRPPKKPHIYIDIPVILVGKNASLNTAIIKRLCPEDDRADRFSESGACDGDPRASDSQKEGPRKKQEGAGRKLSAVGQTDRWTVMVSDGGSFNLTPWGGCEP